MFPNVFFVVVVVVLRKIINLRSKIKVRSKILEEALNKCYFYVALQDHSLHGETLLLTLSNVLVRAPTISFPEATAATKCTKALKVGMLRKEWSKGLGIIAYKQEKTILSQNPCYQCIAKKVITRAVRGHLEYSMPY